jgi:hypothetical protein
MDFKLVSHEFHPKSGDEMEIFSIHLIRPSRSDEELNEEKRFQPFLFVFFSPERKRFLDIISPLLVSNRWTIDQRCHSIVNLQSIEDEAMGREKSQFISNGMKKDSTSNWTSIFQERKRESGGDKNEC